MAKRERKTARNFCANGKASEIAARIAHSNARYVEAVKAINAQAPELLDEIRNGTLAVPDAAQIATLPKQQRAKALALLSGGRSRKTATVVRQIQLESRNGAVTKPTAAGGKVEIWCGDCLKLMAEKLKPGSVSVVVMSPPFNGGVRYDNYDDDRPEGQYLGWLAKVFKAIKRVLRDDGSFFLNVGSTRQKPWTAMKVAQVAGQFFVLQNEIIWVKAVTVEGRSHGHFSPLKGSRYVNHNFESVFHFSKNGDVKLDRLAVGVPYQDEENLLRTRPWATCGVMVTFGSYPTRPPTARSTSAGTPASSPWNCPNGASGSTGSLRTCWCWTPSAAWARRCWQWPSSVWLESAWTFRRFIAPRQNGGWSRKSKLYLRRQWK